MRQGSCIRRTGSLRWLLPAIFVSACGQPGPSSYGALDDGTGVAGELEAYIATYEDGNTAVFYGLRTSSGETIDLVFDTAPDIDAGSYVVVQGARDAEQKFRVTTIQQRPTPSSLARDQRELSLPSDNAAPLSLKIAVLILDPSYTTASAKKRLLDDFDGPKSFYRENTYGGWNIEGDAFGPYTVDVSNCGTRYTQIATDARAAAKSAGVDIETYNQVAYYVPKSASCGWGGLGQAGKMPSRVTGTYKPARDTWYAASLGCVVFNQELGHNYGLQHGHYCSAGPYNGGCAGYAEYGDPHTPLGTGCGHLSAVETGELNGFAPCNVIDVADGSYQIGAIEFGCTGPQVLRWKDPQGALRAEYVHVEYRRKAGHDATRAEGIYIHYGAEFKDPNVVGWQTPANGASDFLVGTGGSAAKAALLAGQSWTAVGGAVFRVVSLSDVATIEVTNTGKSSGATCLDATPAPTTVTCCSTGACGGTPDGGGVPDAGISDSGTIDVATRDAGPSDVAAPEGGPADAGVRDRNSADAVVDAARDTEVDARTDSGAAGGQGGSGGGAGRGGAGGSSAGAGGSSAGTSGKTTGSGGASGSATGGASGSATGGGTATGGKDTGKPGDDAGGCSCRVPVHTHGSGRAWGLTFLLGALLVRRRRH
ncbi:MAG TPA: MYXO-CTERM sorting domain-containing protein [Polyangiaceae bacterium]|nr:MYXO-CTERM sorting domain-containing protein [Polyangiaceae bacterium]